MDIGLPFWLGNDLRASLAHLLIFVVLICPYFCLGEAACATGTSGHVGDCSCAKHNDHPGGKAPLPSDSDTDCLCHGAIIANVQTAEHDDPIPLWDHWLIDDAVVSPIDSSLASISFEPPHQFPPFSTGRDVCVLTRALLL